MTSLDIVQAATVRAILSSGAIDPIANARSAYLAHAADRSACPTGSFLRFREQPSSRIIALTSHLRFGEEGVAALKWVSSFPRNKEVGLPRATAVLLLANLATGRCFACMDGTTISATRTAASAVLAARMLQKPFSRRIISFVGCGPIAASVMRMFATDDWQFDNVLIHDLVHTAALEFMETFEGVARIRTASLDDALQATIVVLATTAAEPYIYGHLFKPHQLIINISLRDISAESILHAQNIVDDREHCLQAGTSLHLAAGLADPNDFIQGTIAEVLQGSVQPDLEKATILSPFGLGILDLNLAFEVYRIAKSENLVTPVPEFFA